MSGGGGGGGAASCWVGKEGRRVGRVRVDVTAEVNLCKKFTFFYYYFFLGGGSGRGGGPIRDCGGGGGIARFGVGESCGVWGM